MVGYVIGADVGGTKTASCAVTRSGEVLERVTEPTPKTSGAAVVDVLLRQSADLAESLGAPPCALGISATGAIDQSTGVIVAGSETIPGWVGLDLTAALRPTGIEHIAVDNDLNAYAIGEHWLGAARAPGPVLVVAVGTGVGAALLLDGQPYRGAHNMAGEIAHIPVAEATGFICPCGRPGHVEAVASGPGVAVTYAAATGGAQPVTGKQVVELMNRGDPVARACVQRAGRALGSALTCVATTIDPELVVIGGGFSAAGSVWFGSCVGVLREELLEPLAHLDVRLGTLGPDAPLLGAAKQAWSLVAE
ncbi:MAG: ROK family protein [Bifidobacteriaceae bacterium]|jgi:glucokinase|nr:ROK family protein [Bifidobacteriaceae bacterium]